jgi:hypothetical protein
MSCLHCAEANSSTLHLLDTYKQSKETMLDVIFTQFPELSGCVLIARRIQTNVIICTGIVNERFT